MSIQNVGTRSLATGTRINTTVPAPGGIRNKDILVLSIYIEDNVVPTPPAGFTAFTGLNPLNFPTNLADLFVWWKRASSEAGDYTITHAGSSTNAVLTVYRGVAAIGSPEVVAPSTNSGISGSAEFVANSITIPAPFSGAMVIYISASWNASSIAVSLAVPGGDNPFFTERFDRLNSVNDPQNWGLHVCDGAAPLIGATGAKTAARDTSDDDWVTTLIGLEPDTSGLRYNGITIAGTGAPVPISATPLAAWDAVITTTAAATITGANSVIMATINAGVPFHIPGLGHEEWEDEAQIDLSQYSITIAGGQTAYVSFAERREE